MLPKNIEEKSDSEIAEKLFGKSAKKELDKLIDVPQQFMKSV